MYSHNTETHQRSTWLDAKKSLMQSGASVTLPIPKRVRLATMSKNTWARKVGLPISSFRKLATHVTTVDNTDTKRVRRPIFVKITIGTQRLRVLERYPSHSISVQPTVDENPCVIVRAPILQEQHTRTCAITPVPELDNGEGANVERCVSRKYILESIYSYFQSPQFCTPPPP